MIRLKVISISAFLFCLAISPAAQDLSSYGYPLEITIPVDVDALYNNYNNSNSKEDYILWDQWQQIQNYHYSQVWSPDGKWIASPGEYLWIVSAGGGVPTILNYEIFLEVQTSIFLNGMSDLCFTPDSQELTYCKIVYDLEKGSIIDVIDTDGVFGARFDNHQYSIESINIYTGEHRVLAEGRQPNWSNDGRYLSYINFDFRTYFEELEADHDQALTILDTITGEKWFLTDGSQYIRSIHFTPDDSAVIFSMDVGDDQSQFFRVSITGGEPEQLSNSISGGEGIGDHRWFFDMTPDGEWLLYTDINFDKTFEYSGFTSGRFYSGTQYVTHLCAFSLATGETYKLFPEPQETNMFGQRASFSKDGTKFCYGLRDFNSRDTTSPNIYIMDYNPDSFRKIVHVEEEKPGGYVLMENYPNPFNPTTKIEFTLPEAGFAELSVYNMAGQKVRDLVSEEMTAGAHSAVWDGCDQDGNLVSSGVFISRLRTRDNLFSNRMILVK